MYYRSGLRQDIQMHHRYVVAVYIEYWLKPRSWVSLEKELGKRQAPRAAPQCGGVRGVGRGV